ncbi:MAG: non-homologous end-joining DNA ligase [Verrucomicrobiota bacterium]|nr:non-homologous end-joining DNA ligase [Verrucomicrobiota bacterium]
MATHVEKLYWPKEKITKGELLDYYESVSRYILPYLKNRPLVMRRFPEGIEGEAFYQKEAGLHVPPFVKTVKVHHEERDISYIVVQNVKTLLYVANLGSIELHPFHSVTSHLDKPDYMIFDLDPEKIPFRKVVEVAQGLHELLDELGMPNFCKTSGGTGLHIYVPLEGRYSYSQIKPFAHQIALVAHQRMPTLTSLDRKPEKRQKRVYIDTLQNWKGQTAVCVYSVRGKPHAPVSTPLLWSEVKGDLDPTDFTLRTIPRRLAKKGDLFREVLKRGINLAVCEKKWEKCHE